MKSCTHPIRQEWTTTSHIAQRTSTAFVCFISAAILQSPVTIVAAGVRTVALSGQPAPGASGVTYESFGSHYDSLAGRFFRGPVLNDAGKTAFRADLTGSGVGLTNSQASGRKDPAVCPWLPGLGTRRRSAKRRELPN